MTGRAGLLAFIGAVLLGSALWLGLLLLARTVWGWLV